MGVTSIAKYLIYIGVFFLLIGSIIFFLGKIGIGIGRLPGDILIKKDNFTFYFPLVTSIIISILLTIILNVFLKK